MKKNSMNELFDLLGRAQDVIDKHFEAKGIERHQAVSVEDGFFDRMTIELWDQQMMLGALMGKWCHHRHEASTCGDCDAEERMLDMMSDVDLEAEETLLLELERSGH